MGTLANSIFQALMGWIRAEALEIWNTCSSPKGTTLMGWVGAHWKGLAVGLCAVGVTVDMIVYLFRWQPYRVWRSQRRCRGQQTEAYRREERPEKGEAETAGPFYDLSEGIPAEAAEELDPSLIRRAQREMKVEPAAMNDAERRDGSIQKTESSLRQNKRSSRRISVARYVENAYDEEAEEEIAACHREWNMGGQAEPSGENSRDEGIDEKEIPGRTTEKFAQAIRPRRRRSVRAMLTDRQDQITETPDQLIDRNEAYRQPVYPRGWTEEEKER